MKLLRFAFIGSGTASVISICALYQNIKEITQQEKCLIPFEVFCIHDPDIKTFPVGEAFGPGQKRVMEMVLGYDLEKSVDLDETSRKGSKIYWEKNGGNNFEILYPQEGMHVNAAKLSPWCLEKLSLKQNFKEIHDNIIEIKQSDHEVTLIGKNNEYSGFDFVFDCTGSPSEKELNTSKYNLPKFEFVNTALLYQDFKKYDEPYSTNYVHENGWMFGIPLKHRKTYGYCYNKNMTSYDDALNNFQDTLKNYVNIENINVDEIKKLSWKQYYKKDAADNRVLTLGNKLYLFDPNMGLAAHFFMFLIRKFIYNCLSHHLFYNLPFEDMINSFNTWYRISIKEVEALIALNYATPNKIDNHYWNEISPKAQNVLKECITLEKWFADCEIGETDKFLFHSNRLMFLYLNGYNVKLKDIYYEKNCNNR